MGSPDGEGVGTSWTWTLLALSPQYGWEDRQGSSQCETEPNRKSSVSQAPAASTALSEVPGDGSSGQQEEKAEAPRSPEPSPCLQNGGGPPAQSR